MKHTHQLLNWGWSSTYSNPEALTISAARWSLNMPGGGISKSSPTLKERVKNIKCGKTPAYKSKSESKQWNLKNSKPLFYGSGFAWHKPHQQALALSAECYLLNGYQLINLDSDVNFGQGYWTRSRKWVRIWNDSFRWFWHRKRYICFGAQSFVHFSAQTQLCSKKLSMWLQWFIGSKLWPKNIIWDEGSTASTDKNWNIDWLIKIGTLMGLINV